MACLYCGKELGPLQLLRDDEFCTPAHRERYRERLGRALHLVAESEKTPTRAADFAETWPVQHGKLQQSVRYEFDHGKPVIQFRSDFGIAIRPVRGSEPVRAKAPAAASPGLSQTFTADFTPLHASVAAGPQLNASRVLSEIAPATALERMLLKSPELDAAAPAGNAAVMSQEQTGNAKLPVFAMPSPATGAPAPLQSELAVALSPVAPAADPAGISEEQPGTTSLPAPALPALAAGAPAPLQSELAVALTAAAPGEAKIATTGTAADPQIPQARILPFSVRPAASAASLRSIETEADVEPAVSSPASHVPISTPGPWYEPNFATAAPVFDLQLTQESSEAAGSSDAPRRALFTAPVLCGLCLPGPQPEPAVCSVTLRADLSWHWPVPELVYPFGITAADTAVPELPAGLTPAEVPAPEAAQGSLAAVESCEPVDAVWEVQLPSSLQRAAQTAAVPLSRAAAAPEAIPDAGPVLPASAAWIPPEPAPARAASLEAAAPAGSSHVEIRIAGAAAFHAEPAESLMPGAVAADALQCDIALQHPALKLAAVLPSLEMAPCTNSTAAASAPAPAAIAAAELEVLPAIAVAPPQYSLSVPVDTVVPRAGVQPLEFYCQRSTLGPSASLAWRMPTPAVNAPRFLVQAALDPLEQRTAPPPAKKRKKSGAAEVFKMPEARQLRASRVREIAKPIAAGLLIGAFLWVAATTMRVANTGVNNDIATAIQGGRSGAGAVAGKKARPNAAPGAPGSTTASAQTGFFGRMRQVIATRAAYQVTESFHAGMSAWGDPKSGAPAGWSHSADGYVRPAALAFFRPSMEFRDYRMEFFGQIEDKSMSWAVRAHDAKNYYAMKVKVLEPGLRETVALEHYPVVAGIKGHKVEVPLPQIMIHSRTPYHVEVAVRGNRITASIEGQQVDSWTDDILPKGGVGLFAEAGERARVYWLKVSRNEDFIGRVCAYISGNSGDAADSIADLWRGEGTPAGPAQPGNGLPAERADIGLATAFALRSTGRRRFPKWRS